MSTIETGTVDLSAAAAMVVAIAETPLLTRESAGALDVWELLTGTKGEVALALARLLAATEQRAALIPF